MSRRRGKIASNRRLSGGCGPWTARNSYPCKRFTLLDSLKRGSYTRGVTQVRFRELSSSIVAHAAQLVYTGKTTDSYRLLSAADRLFRSLADPGIGEPAPLADELALAASFLEILRILTSLEIELVVDLDEEARSALFVGCGSLVDAMDQVVAAHAAAAEPIRIVLVQDRDREGQRTGARGGGHPGADPRGGRSDEASTSCRR